jgi:hypothetical protein
VSITSVLTRLVIIAAVVTGLAAVGRAAGPKWRPAPTPGSADRRGRKDLHLLTIFAMVLGALVVLVVVAFALFIGTWWLACRDSSGSC